VPLFFHGICGKDEREGNSPSWFNRDEVLQVVDHVKDLMRPRNGVLTKLTPADIGISTPSGIEPQTARWRSVLRSSVH
jgi:helicase MOV-10